VRRVTLEDEGRAPIETVVPVFAGAAP
jgi:hypothetical protein